MTRLTVFLAFLLTLTACSQVGEPEPEPEIYHVSVEVIGEGSAIGSGSFTDGDLVELSAVPETGYDFEGWFEAGQLLASEQKLSFSVQADRQLTAQFQPQSFTVTLEAHPGVDSLSGDGEYEFGQSATVEARPLPDYEFLNWELNGSDVSPNSAYTFIITEDVVLTARFSFKGLPLSDGDDLFALVTKQTTLNRYAPDDLKEIPAAMKQRPDRSRPLRREALEHLELMWQAAKADGISLLVNSAYRSYETQAEMFANYARNHGEEAANRFSARPGQSEHQLGTAVDFGGTSKDFTPGFADTEPGRWLLANAHRYGFALSYPKDSEHISGYIYEPWHYRYIGIEAAEAWKQSGQVLAVFLQSGALPVLGD